MTDFPLNIISININRGDVNYNIQPHIHNVWQFYYVHSGDVEMAIGDKIYRMGQGDAVMIPPGLVRHPKCVGKAPVYTFVFFESSQIDLNALAGTILHANAQQQTRFQEIYDEMHLPKDADSAALMRCSLVSLLIELKRNLKETLPPAQEHYQSVVSRLDTFMRSNISQPLTRKDLAKIVHMSQPHLARIFQNVLGMTPLERLTQLRMQHAQMLLSQSTQSITSISAAVSYESISHFSRTFKKFSGKTPREFRKMVMLRP